jgi:type II secretory pathway component PulF
MPSYAYKALDARGKIIEGQLNVADQAEVERYFLESELTPVRIEEQTGGRAEPVAATLRAAAGKTRPWWLPRFDFKRKLLDNELIAFTRQFAAAYGAGIPVFDILALLSGQARHLRFRAALEEIRVMIREGKGLTESFACFPDFFDKTYLSILNAGEVSGNLDNTLNYSSGLMEKKLLHREKLKSTLLYPKLVLGMIGITATVVVIFVIPQFAKLYDKFDAELPLPTLMLVALADYVKKYWWTLPAFVPPIFVLVQYLKRHEDFMLWWDEMVLKLPILGITFLKMELTHFCTTFALLLRSGIKITDATQISIEGMRNSFLRREMLTIIPTLEGGGTLASALANVPVVPALMSSMIAIGEESGTLEELLDKVSQLYDNETELMLKKLPTLLEPIILGFLFVLVFCLALAVYLPMWRMASLVRK